MDEDDQLRGFPALLSSIAEGGRKAPAGIEQETAAYLRARTIIAAASDEETSLEPVYQHPGYLTRQIGGRPIFVPFNLASVFPGSDMVADVMRIADTISLHPDDPVCISGSTTFLGAINQIGDLDFCEYYISDPAHLPDHALGVSGDEDVPLVWLKCGGSDLKGPWAQRRPEVETLFSNSEHKRMKLDFISNSALGLLPTTSVVIATKDENEAARHSFAYQEAVVFGSGPVRNLISPARFGEYVNWLRSEIRKLAAPTLERSGDPIKALKRALSLMLIAGRHGDTSDIIEALHKSELSSIVLQVRVEELERMLRDLPDELSDRFATPLNELKDGLEEVLDTEIDQALSAARELALASLDIVEEEFRLHG